MRQATDKNWKQVEHGGVIDAGTAYEYETGDWRSRRPIWDSSKCTHCLICWISCPDGSILVAEGKMNGIDYVHCKGCGICAQECPLTARAIRMIDESEARD